MMSSTSYNSKSCPHRMETAASEEREELQFDWMDGKPAPDAVLAQGPASFPVVFAWLMV